MMMKIQKKGRPVRPAWTAQAICATSIKMPNKDIREAPQERGFYIIWRAAVPNPNLPRA